MSFVHEAKKIVEAEVAPYKALGVTASHRSVVQCVNPRRCAQMPLPLRHSRPIANG